MALLSIVIPTHERFHYARPTVEAILSLGGDLEIVVSDTSAQNPWLDSAVVDAGGRLRIVRPGPGLSVVDNFEAALRHARGDYICFIGDDDLISGDILRAAAWARDHEVEAVRVTFPMLYYWPDYAHRSLRGLYEGTLWTTRYSGRTTELDTRHALAEAAGRLGRGVGRMPRAYCGLVGRPLVERIIAKHGALFGGVSPDIYSAVLISHHAHNTVEIDFPLIIPGASGASTAGQSAAGRHVGKLRDNDHIRPFVDLHWHPLIPEFYSVPTVWSYSLVMALEELGGENAVRRAGWGRLYVQCLLYHRQYTSETRSAMKAFCESYSTARLWWELVKGFVKEAGWIASKLFERVAIALHSGKGKRRDKLNSPAEAMLAVVQALSTGPSLEFPSKV